MQEWQPLTICGVTTHTDRDPIVEISSSNVLASFKQKSTSSKLSCFFLLHYALNKNKRVNMHDECSPFFTTTLAQHHDTVHQLYHQHILRLWSVFQTVDVSACAVSILSVNFVIYRLYSWSSTHHKQRAMSETAYHSKNTRSNRKNAAFQYGETLVKHLIWWKH